FPACPGRGAMGPGSRAARRTWTAPHPCEGRGSWSPCARATFNGRRKRQAFRARRTGTYPFRCSPSKAYTAPTGGPIKEVAQHPKSELSAASPCIVIRSWAAQGLHYRERGFVIGHLIDISQPCCRWHWQQFAELLHGNPGNVRLQRCQPTPGLLHAPPPL